MLSVMRGAARARLTSICTAAAAAAVVVAFAAPASADPVQGAFAGMDDSTKSSVKIKKGTTKKDLTTGLLKLKVKGTGQVLLTYCIEINTRAKKVDYWESDWGQTTLGGKAKHVNWILHNSYPFIGLGELAQKAGLDAAPSQPDAVAGTQAAIWHYSDGHDMRLGENKPVVEKIYTYLTGAANTGLENEPAPTLSLSPDAVSGEPGKVLGPIQVTTSAKQVNVTLADAPDGAKLLGPDKETEVTTAKNGDKLWVSIPKDAEDGSAKITADVTAKVSPGRVFKSKEKSQTLILADSDEVKAHDEVNVSWAKVPTPTPGSSSEQVCEPNAGVKITLTNEGDADAEFTIEYGDKTDTETVKPGESKVGVVPVDEDTAYKITVKSGDYVKVHEGVLNCLKDEPSPSPSEPGSGGDLPKTGLNNLTLYLGIGVALFVAGALLLLAVRRRARSEA
ncbi:MAG: TQXA domain-containing protein [Micromonosporaceae bacterium]|nr:TQXA domain-containing protein [Micromonosporaceae bacterium]